MKCIKKLVALTLAAVLALAMLTACGGTPSVQDTTEKTKQIVDNINAVRTENGLSELEINTVATDVANKILELKEKKALNLIPEEDYQTKWRELNAIQVDGRSQNGYVSVSSTSSSEKAMGKEDWQKNYDRNEDDSICRIVRSAKAKYVGVAMKQLSNGKYLAVVVTY